MRVRLAHAVLLAVAIGTAASCRRGKPDMQVELRELLTENEAKAAPLEKQANLAWWEAATTGNEDAYKRLAKLTTELETLYVSKKKFALVKEIRESGAVVDGLERRQLELLYLRYLGRQLDPKLLRRMIEASTAIEQRFATFRAHVDGKEVTDNQIDEVLRSSRDRGERKAYWLASKQVGAELAGEVVAVVKLRNQAAQTLGFKSFFQMQLVLAEQDEKWLSDIFLQLTRLTSEPFAEAKKRISDVVAARLATRPGDLMPWDLADRFFQVAPGLSPDTDLDRYLLSRDLAKLAGSFYAGIGLDPAAILARSDLLEHAGKNPHAFSIDIDRAGDVRALLNLRPTERWLDTTLHELGHGVYDSNRDASLPWLLRAPGHTLITEGVAMMLGRLGHNAGFYRAIGILDDAAAARLAAPLREEQRVNALVFARWSQVMYHFEKNLYGNPEQDLDALWWKVVRRYQGLKRPKEAPKGAWASKIHLVTVPVYYHNYLLGELFGAQLHTAICRQLYPGQDPRAVVYAGNPAVGAFLKEKLFSHGASLPWPELVTAATGEALSPSAFAALLLGLPSGATATPAPAPSGAQPSAPAGSPPPTPTEEPEG